MKYLLQTEKDINTAFIVKPYNPKKVVFIGDNDKLLTNIHGDVYNPILPKTSKTIVECWTLYELERFDDEVEKISIDLSKYNPKKHYVQFKFDKLITTLNLNDFREDIIECIYKAQQLYLKDIEKGLLNASTDFKIKRSITHKIETIQSAIHFLLQLKLNKIQAIVREEYLKSYRKTLIHIHNEYEAYIPKVVDTGLNKFIIHSKITQLLTIENQLIEYDFIQKSADKLYWNTARGYKVKLVNFCRLLKAKGYINEYMTIEKVIDFFEKRYNMNTGDQSKPSKFNGSDKQIEVDFYFLSF